MEMDDFRKSVEEILEQARRDAEKRKAQVEKIEAEKEKDLLLFDRHADRLQDEVIEPRIEYLASLFENAFKPEVVEETEYRHRIHVHFGHTTRFPCTADVTFLIVHDKHPDFLLVKFEYIILPAYVTEQYKFSGSVRVKMEEASDAEVAALAESGIKTFLENYIKVKEE